MTPSFNKQWHAEHRLGKGAGLDDRIQWHLEHDKVCGCRPIPDAILKEIERRRATKKYGSEAGELGIHPLMARPQSDSQ